MSKGDLQKTTELADLDQPETRKKGEPMSRLIGTRGWLLLALLLVVGAGLFYFSSSKSEKNASVDHKKDAAVPVSAAVAQMKVVPIEIRSIGNVLPFSVVNVVPQVGGQLISVAFRQGQFVKKGDLLFRIEPASYRAALAQAEGNVARDEAQVQQAEANVQKDLAQVEQIRANLTKDQALGQYAQAQDARYSLLVSQGAVSREQGDQMKTNLVGAHSTVQGDLMAIKNAESVVNADKAAIRTAKGTLAADQAAAQTAKIQLSWTEIRSPINGKTSSLNVYEGNVVSANGAPLMSIAEIEPIYVTFTVPEQYLSQVRTAMHEHKLRVQALIEGAKAEPVEGAVSFLENSVNTATGTIAMRAAFANTDRRLFPGQFVDVTVTIPVENPSVVVPSAALQTTQQGNAVFVVKPDHTVELVPVRLDRSTADLAALGSGISAGDMVVTDGQLQLAPGSRVNIVDRAKKRRGN